MNKKSILFIALALFMSASIFAAASSTFKVKSITGKVTYEATPGNWKNVTQGQELLASTVINTSLNSTVVVTVDGKDVTIKAMQKDTIDSLVAAANGVAKKRSSGLRSTSVQDATNGVTSGTATASSRSHEYKEDVAWDE